MSNNKFLVFAALFVLISAVSTAQPVISAVGNAFSELPDVTRGAWFIVTGTGLGPANIAVAGAPYPPTLGGTSISFTPAAGGTAIPTPMYYSLNLKLCGMLPSSTPAGDYDVKVTYNGATSAAKRVKVVERAFGFATQSSNGKGPAQATYGGKDLNRFVTGTVADWAVRPAKPGDAMILWGTGLGADAASDTGGTSGDQTAAGSIRVIVGGAEVTPAYAGRSSGSPGLDQINFSVPTSTTPGCFVSIQVRAGGRLSNAGSIAVVPAGTSACTHPALSAAQLQKLDAGGTLAYGNVALGKMSMKLTVPVLGSIDQVTETVGAAFGKYTVDTLGGATFSMTPGQCTVIQRTGTQDQLLLDVPAVLLDAGAQLTLNGPNASNKAIPRATDKSYSLSLYSSGLGALGGGSGTPTLAAGSYTVAGTGGPDVGAFSAKVDFPGAFTWTNADTLPNPIPRSSNLNITWTGGGSGLVEIVGVSLSAIAAGSSTYNATGFICISPASANSFSVPSSVMQQMPQVSGDFTAISSGSAFGVLMVNATSDPTKGSFTAPLTAGGSIDQAEISGSVGATRLTGYN